MPDDEINEIKELYREARDAWYETYREGDEDMRFIAGDAWPVAEQRQRRLKNRPCLNLDELGQYINQRINDIRQNKRAIKLTPAGNGADERTAAVRADIIRGIEARGGLQAYVVGYENAIQRGMGFWGVGKRYVSHDSFDQELYIRHMPNSRAVYVDPSTREPAGRDMRYAFVMEHMTEKEFRQKWPKAKMVSGLFWESQGISWMGTANSASVVECWRKSSKKDVLFLIPSMRDDGSFDRENPHAILKSQLPDGFAIESSVLKVDLGGRIVEAEVIRERPTEIPSVEQVITNGEEILERYAWEGTYIPIVVCFGRTYWIEGRTGSERVVESLIRKARDAQLLHNYIATAKLEAISQVLKAPFIGYEGQFVGHEEEWETANRTPYAYLTVRPTTEETGNAILPLPIRNQWDPQIGGYEIADESAKRSIQNAIGMYNASVGRSDSTVRSGKAIIALDVQSDQGNYHFIDNFDQAIQQTGVILDEMIPYVYDTTREVMIAREDGSAGKIMINEPASILKGSRSVRTDIGKHAVTVTTGPSYQSQREMAEKTADLLLESQIFGPRIADLAIKLKNLGPIGDKIAERLTPPEFIGEDNSNPAVLAGKLRQMVELNRKLTEALNEATRRLESKNDQYEAQKQIAALEAQTELAVAAIRSDTKRSTEVLRAQMEELKLLIENIAGVGRKPEPAQHEAMNAP